jgi:hypothetical protein
LPRFYFVGPAAGTVRQRVYPPLRRLTDLIGAEGTPAASSTHHAGGPGGVVEQSLVPAVAHLDIMSAHFGVGGPLLCIDTELDHGESNFELPLAFGDPQDAHGAFKPVFSAGFRFITPYIHLLLNEILLNYEALHLSRFNRFSQSFEQFYKAHTPI